MPTKAEIKDWLKRIGKTRQWLADQCGVSKVTVNGWFVSRGSVPSAKMIIIMNLMQQEKTDFSVHEYQTVSNDEEYMDLSTDYTVDEWDRLLKVSEALGITPEQLQHDAVLGVLNMGNGPRK